VIDIKALTAPFPPDRVSWRVGSTTADRKRGMALAYIDARDVMDRLDEVCGPENWQCRYPHANGKTVCEIGIRINGEWIWKADGAGDTDFEAEKGALSDAFKRAAVRWGIGRYLYDLEAPWVDIEVSGRSVRIAPYETAKLRDLLMRRMKRAPAATRGFQLIAPDTGDAVMYDRGGAFLDALESAMRAGNATEWWTANAATARRLAERFPQAAKRVEELEQLTLQPA